MEKIMKLAALMREAKALIDEIEREKDRTGISVIEVKADWSHSVPNIHLYTGMPDVTNHAPCSRKYVECGSGDYWEYSATIEGVNYTEINLQTAKEAANNAKLAV